MAQRENNEVENNEAEHDHSYTWDPEREPLDKDEQQAEASQYGLYGYADQAGQEMTSDPEARAPEERSEADAASEQAAKAPPERHEQGGQEWDQSEHGAGFAQPMSGPQREASQSTRPREKE